MKKTLLTLALMVLGLSAYAANITEDWTTAQDWAVTSWKKGNTTPVEKVSPTTGITYTFMGSCINKYGNDPAYLFIKGKDTAKAYISFSLPIDCAEIILSTGKTSTSSGSKINVYAGDTQIVSALPVTSQDTDYKISIPAKNRAKGTVYKIETNTKSYNQQFYKFTYLEPTTEPSLSIAKDEVKFAVPLKGVQSATLTGVAENIDGDISIAVDNENFELSTNTVSTSQLADGIVVTYTGNVAGNETAKLTFSAGEISAEVTLSGVTVANEGTAANPLTVADVLAMNNLNKGPFHVTGTISEYCSDTAKNGMVSESTSLVASNIILQDADGKMIGVQLSGDARTKLNIVDNTTNIGKTVVIKGNLEAYFGAPGVKNTEYVSGLDDTTGIADIVADDANAPVEFFNLQGIRVENPEAGGLYIRRQGSKVGKVLVK